MRAAFLCCFSTGVFCRAAEFEARPLKIPAGSKVGFTLMSPRETGVLFTNFLADVSAEKNRILENGSGVALGDVDGDGLCDIYFCSLEPIFIGSTDIGEPRGYFLIADRDGAEVTRQFYLRRIGAQQENLRHLEELIDESGL